MTAVKFTATRLASTGKKGVLKPDENGYYTMPVGGLNAFNSVGDYYTLEGARELFSSSSLFMKRVQNGALKAEVGHPQMEKGQSMDDYIDRILRIDDNNVCGHFSEIWLDEGFGKKYPEYKNPQLCAIMAKVKPSGLKAKVLTDMFEDPLQNPCFSIRALTRDYFNRGQKFRVLNTIVTFDQVNMPGISHATKWSSPALESDVMIPASKESLQKIISLPTFVATEDSRQLAQEALNRLNTPFKMPKDSPIYHKW